MAEHENTLPPEWAHLQPGINYAKAQGLCGKLTSNYSHMCIRDVGHGGRCFQNLFPFDQEAMND